MISQGADQGSKRSTKQNTSAWLLRLFLAVWLVPASFAYGTEVQLDNAVSPTAEAEEGVERDTTEVDTEGDATTEADAESEAAEDPALLALRAEQRERAQSLVAQIEALSYSVGSYDPTLIELQEDLGRTWLALEQYELAHEVLEQAMQLVRVNDGLYSDRQIALLQQLVQANTGRREWERADVYAHLAFDLQGRIYPEDSSEYAGALLALSDWKLQAARFNLLSRTGAPQTLHMLQDLQDQHDAALVHARNRGDLEQQWSLLYAKARTEVEVARGYNYQNLSDFSSASPRFVMQTVCSTVSDGAGGFERVCWQERTSNPDYMYGAHTQRRQMTDRARMRLQATAREMRTLLDENPDFTAANQDRVDASLENIDEALTEVQRQARRASMSQLRQW